MVIHGIGRRAMPGNYTALDLSKPFDVDFTPDVVIHAAARALPWGSKADFETQNVAATQNVADFCTPEKGAPGSFTFRRARCFTGRRINSASRRGTPIGPRFLNRYAETKYTGERLVREFPGSWAILRPRAVFGPGDTVLFPRILEAARRGKLARLTRPGGGGAGET